MRSTLPLTTIKIPPNGIHLILKIRINGKPARMVLDTGASQTVLDISRIHRFTTEKAFKKTGGHSSGIGSGKLESHFFPSKKIQLGTCILSDLELVLLDLQHVNQSYATIKKKPVDGVLGGDILTMLEAVIDYRKKEILFRQKSR